ncbi:MAG: hypothetical protein LUI60_05450 [Clostridia bacterium]|nr:hypothetical protein [Clostridia bacterium]
MKKFTRIISAVVAVVMGASVFAFAACDSTTDDPTSSTTESSSSESTSSNSESTSSTSSENTNTNNDKTEDDEATKLANGALGTLADIVTSETGYEIGLSADLGLTIEEAGSLTANASATIKTKSVNNELYLDAKGEVAATMGGSSNATVAETSTDADSYTYCGLAYIRGDDIYFTFDTSTLSDATDLTYYHVSTDYEADNEDEEAVNVLDEYMAAYENGDYDELISSVSNIAGTLLSDIKGTAATTSTGYSLTYDVDNILLGYVSDVNALTTLIVNASSSLAAGSDYTLGEFLNASAVQNVIEGYLGDLTGKDLYDLANMIATLAGADIDISTMIPEGTATQTAYDYIKAVVNGLAVGEDSNGDVVYLSSMPLNDESLSEYFTMIATATDDLKTMLESAKFEIAFAYNTSYALTGVSIDVEDVGYAGYEVDLNFDVTFENKAVTLDDLTDIVYIVNSCGTYVTLYDNNEEEEIGHYEIETIALSDNSIIISVAVIFYSNETQNDIYETYVGTYTDEDGAITKITLTNEDETTTEITMDGNYYSITVSGYTLTGFISL